MASFFTIPRHGRSTTVSIMRIALRVRAKRFLLFRSYERGEPDIAAPQVIQSFKNPRVKHALKLRESRSRRKCGEFLIDGETEICRALEHGIQISALFCEAAALSSQRILAHRNLAGESLRSATSALDVSVFDVSAAILKKLSYGERGDEPVAIAATPPRPLATLQLSAASRLLVLDQTEKPGNIGACLRTAAACGVDAVILCDPICELFNPNTIRASRGHVFSLPIAQTTTAEFLELAQQLGLPLLAARVDGEHSLWNLPLAAGFAVVFGNEASGLGANWKQPAVQTFQIPMAHTTDSLNLSISAAVTLYEAVRQQTAKIVDPSTSDV